jgi:taurine dioxygenase
MRTQANAIGCSIFDVDAGTLAGAEMDEVKDLLYRHRLIVLKDQALDDKAYCDFAGRFGSPVPYLQENYRHPDFPLIFVSSNVKKDGKQIGVPRTGGYWHSDTSFEPDPKVITMLMPKALPKTVARSTRFIDMAEVYAALPQATKDRLAGAQLVHSGRWRYKVRPQDAGADIFEILQMIDSVAPPVRHPAVLEHPRTKEKVLYANSGFTIGIAGWSTDEAAGLLREIFEFAESDRFIREVRWSTGDIIIWDNRFLSHSSGRNPGPEEETMMYRITLKDAYPLCGSQMTSGRAAA